MENKSTPLNVKLDDLVLDKNNPRFAELYSGSDNEDDIINYLLFEESAEEVAKGIITAQEYYPDRPLWVIKVDDKYLVKDGNRRCAAVKALQNPESYNLAQLPKFEMAELPVLLYHNVKDVEERIRTEHTGNLFRNWGRIAKAIEVHRLLVGGMKVEEMNEIDSSPKELIKLANFYYKAVKIGKEDFKMLLRSGKGKTGGKTVIFERLFKKRNSCGYNFKPVTNEIEITDGKKFKSYINAMVAYLKDNPRMTAKGLDSEIKTFLDSLNKYGFPPKETISTPDKEEDSNPQPSFNFGNSVNDSSSSSSNTSEAPIELPKEDINNPIPTFKPEPLNPTPNGGRKSLKKYPSYTRKGLPSGLDKLIKECFGLSATNNPNAKLALCRVTFECVLKYVVENTMKSNGKSLKDSNHFAFAFKDKHGNELKTTNFGELKKKFEQLIKPTVDQKAFETFDLDLLHQIIHSYKVSGMPQNAEVACDNLMYLIEFMLQEENDLKTKLDLEKLR